MEYRKPEILLVMSAAEAIQSSLDKGEPLPDSDGGPIPSNGSAYQADE
jgi:hypothetical protein